MKPDPFKANDLLKRTLNFPLYLGDPTEKRWTVELTPQYIDEIAKTGFSAIRLAIDWSAHTTKDSPYTVHQHTLDAVSEYVHQLTKKGLAVVIDNHMYAELMADPEAYKARFLAIVQQLAKHFKHEPASVF